MTEFEITVNGNTETVHAKHIVGGNFLVRKLKTCNLAQVQYIETVVGDRGRKKYRIRNFWPTSQYAGMTNIDQKVEIVENEI